MPSETQTGLIGEHLACAAILQMPGIRGASLSQQDKVDIVAWDDIGFIRVQVKSATLRQSDKRVSSWKYGFNNGSGRDKRLPTVADYDIIAHCAIERRLCIFTATSAVRTLTSRYSPRRFDDASVEVDSWVKALEIIRS